MSLVDMSCVPGAVYFNACLIFLWVVVPFLGRFQQSGSWCSSVGRVRRPDFVGESTPVGYGILNLRRSRINNSGAGGGRNKSGKQPLPNKRDLGVALKVLTADAAEEEPKQEDEFNFIVSEHPNSRTIHATPEVDQNDFLLEIKWFR